MVVEVEVLKKLAAGQIFSTYYTVSIFKSNRKITNIDKEGDFVLE